MPLYRSLAALLSVQSIFASLAGAQQPAVSGTPVTAPMVESLKILVLEGQHSSNNVARHLGVQPVVEVRDDNDRPVEGATVVFRLPPTGPGGSFPGQKLTATVKTNTQGQAGAGALVPNDELGRFNIQVTATIANRMGETVITQTNTPSELSMVGLPAKKKTPLWRNKYVLIGAGAAVAVVLVVVLTRSSAPAAASSTVTITQVGPITVNQ